MTLLKSLTIAACAALLALILYAGQPESLSWWAFALPFTAWIVGPAAVPYLWARRRGGRAIAAMTAFLILSSALSAFAYHHAFFVSRSSTAALVMIFVPLYQWAALGCVVIVGVVADRWMRRG